jgi:hypothetical protein
LVRLLKNVQRQGIRENQTFSINIPSTGMVEAMPDNRFWTVGDYIGKAWGFGKKLKEKPI